MEHYLEDFARLNKEYLLLAREIARTDQEFGRTALGLNQAAMEAVAKMTVPQIEKVVAHPHLLQFKLRFSSKYWEQVLAVSETNASSPTSLRILATAHALEEGIEK